MSRAATGVIWALAFVALESLQFVFFGGIFQRVSSVLFGSIAFAIVVAGFVGWSAWRRREDLLNAIRQPGLLLLINVTATASWLMLLLAVQIIEPATAYTVGSGAMPIAAWAAYRLGFAESDAPRNRAEKLGIVLIGFSLIYLSAITVAGWSGFARGGPVAAMTGIALAFAEGVLFTFLLIFCRRLNRSGVGPSTVFGIRFVLYVIVAGMLAGAGFDAKGTIGSGELSIFVALGLLLIVPPLFALQQAVSLVSTLTISVLTALGPFVIFVLQSVEGRVDHSWATLFGLTLFFAGANLSAIGAVRAQTRTPVSG
ncbi:MAG: hypothetical protein AAGD13_17650 [Pseudomonadota bacterium]